MIIRRELPADAETLRQLLSEVYADTMYPKPLRGEREFGIAPIVRASELGHDRDLVLERLDRQTSELGQDRESARLWSFAQTLA